ncbi:hypothetical protein BKI52_29870 [marine bacterium AO1-C]|nr:hypothetical protein BKI52_29870 [marine bacterium AO1-C]
MKINVHSETGRLNSVILGIAHDRGVVNHVNNPKHAEIAQRGEEPTEEVLIQQVEAFAHLLEAHDVEVLRPENIAGQDQIFCRDIGFSIGDHFFLANMRKANRQPEVNAIKLLLQSVAKVHQAPSEVVMEGGDIIVWKDYVFVGLGERTNEAGLKYLQNALKGEKEVIGLPVNVTNEGISNILHLDCAFQPVGDQHGLIYKEGFQSFPDAIYDVFGPKNLIEVTQEEMYHMFPNVFSIHPELAVVEQSFDRLVVELKKCNIQTLKTPYAEVAKLGGLLRCSTCPLSREDL